MSAFLSFSGHCANERSKTLVSVTPASPALGDGLATSARAAGTGTAPAGGCWGWGSAPALGDAHLPELGGNGLISAQSLSQLKSQLLIEDKK